MINIQLFTHPTRKPSGTPYRKLQRELVCSFCSNTGSNRHPSQPREGYKAMKDAIVGKIMKELLNTNQQT
jgi:hypothetical protein